HRRQHLPRAAAEQRQHPGQGQCADADQGRGESAGQASRRPRHARHIQGRRARRGAVHWLGEAAPPQQQVMQRIPQAPDSVLKPFVKSVATQQLLLLRADSAKVQLKPEDQAAMYNSISQLVGNVENSLGVAPQMLADSAKSTAEKERLAASRVDGYLDRMMAGLAQPMTVPLPLKKILDAKYEASVNDAGLDRAVERAKKVRASADSARTAAQPKSQVPMPGVGGPPAQSPPAQSPPPPAPSPKKP